MIVREIENNVVEGEKGSILVTNDIQTKRLGQQMQKRTHHKGLTCGKYPPSSPKVAGFLEGYWPPELPTRHWDPCYCP